MDGGSGLNILYAETLKGMGILMSKLSETNMSFHGVIPSWENRHHPLPCPHPCLTPFPSPWVVSLGTAGSGADTVEWYASGK